MRMIVLLFVIACGKSTPPPDAGLNLNQRCEGCMSACCLRLHTCNCRDFYDAAVHD